MVKLNPRNRLTSLKHKAKDWQANGLLGLMVVDLTIVC